MLLAVREEKAITNAAEPRYRWGFIGPTRSLRDRIGVSLQARGNAGFEVVWCAKSGAKVADLASSLPPAVLPARLTQALTLVRAMAARIGGGIGKPPFAAYCCGSYRSRWPRADGEADNAGELLDAGFRILAVRRQRFPLVRQSAPTRQ